MNIPKKLIRGIDFLFALILSVVFLMSLFIRRIFGKIQIKDPRDRVLSITKDGIYVDKWDRVNTLAFRRTL